MDLPRPDIDIDRFIGEKRAVALGQPDRLEQRRFARSEDRQASDLTFAVTGARNVAASILS
jgi:hypothetical protein